MTINNRLVTIVWLVLILSALIGLLYMMFTTDVLNTPIDSLPALYWGLALSLLILIALPINVKPIRIKGTRPVASNRDSFSTEIVFYVLGAVIFLAFALEHSISRHDSGGETVFLAVVGTFNVIAAIRTAMRARAKKRLEAPPGG